MKIEVVLTIVGAFLALGLGVNAFFLKGIYAELGVLQVEFAKMFERGIAKEKRIDDLETNEKEIFERLNILEREVLK